MRAAAVLAALVALALPAAAARSAPAQIAAQLRAGPAAPVLGVDWSVPGARLAWYDPATLRILPGRKAPLGNHACSWSFSAGRTLLAIAACEAPELRFVDARTMRVRGDVVLGPLDTNPALVTWVRADRVLALLTRPAGSSVAVVDPGRRKTLRRVALGGLAYGGGARLADGVALLVGPNSGFGAARVAVVGADGAVRSVVLDRIAVGSTIDESGSTPRFQTRLPGFAVDPAGRTAFVVAPDRLVAEVDLDTLAVRYHEPASSPGARFLRWLQPAAIAKTLDGPSRVARWLGNGLIAVSGADYSTVQDAKGQIDVRAAPFGLRLADTRDWGWRTVDAGATWFAAGPDVLAVDLGPGNTRHTEVVYGFDGSERYRLTLEGSTYLDVNGAFGYVCDSDRLRAVLDVSAGATETTLDAAEARRCAPLLSGSSSEW